MRLDSEMRWLGCILAAALLLGPPLARAESSRTEEGHELFLEYCASCHGADAKGNGPEAADLKVSPPDLTRIQPKGKRFPAGRVADRIDGEKIVSAHGTSVMPVWGRVLGTDVGYSQAQNEISKIVDFLGSVQANREGE